MRNRKGVINHLLFMDGLKLQGMDEKQVHTVVNTARIFTKDIGLEFGISKCACKGIALTDAKSTREHMRKVTGVSTLEYWRQMM